ncbi:MAG: single-stranded-DNA-specific exonuclease RecJ [Rhodospirillaceae bacterium]|nr:single-stranded-DNA-specific exonuclease RecJ [Rhodospirillaceae bacterium]
MPDGGVLPPVLNVECSLAGRRWQPRVGNSVSVDERLGLAMSQRFDLPEIIGRLLALRGIGLDDAESFLQPSLKSALPDPSHLKDMDAAVARIVDALENCEPLAVFGDYDVDGATSAAILHRYFASIGADLRIYVPDRIKEGYGPNAEALLKLHRDGMRVVFTVDCGITAHDSLTAAQKAGLDVIVLDHHVAESALPPAAAVVNPNRLDDNSPHKTLAAVGVAFLFLVALNRALRARGKFSPGAEPDLIALLDLVALGTVCDVVPLIGLNRVLVAQGLRIMARRQNTGLKVLADVASITSPPGTYHAGFLLGPRINAGGRVGQADLGARLLATDDPIVALSLAEKLDHYNTERKAIEQAVLNEAMALAEQQVADGVSFILVADRGWHPGVIGIVASRIVDRFNRPACVAGIDGSIAKASCRSVTGIDLGAAIVAARQAGLLMSGGGHKMAGGFTAAADGIDAVHAFLRERLDWASVVVGAVRALTIDATLTPAAATRSLQQEIEKVGPVGAGNAEPRFALAGVRIAKADIVGDAHVRCQLADSQGCRLKAIAFGCAAEPLGQALLQSRGGGLHLAGKLRADDWQGREDVQFLIDDGALLAR